MTDRPTRREGIIEREVGNDRMLYDPVEKAVHVLNESAQFIWQRCDGTRTVEDIAREAAEAAGAALEEVRRDVEECVVTFRELAMVE